ncbi:hypothetical protein [Halobacillus sp. BBL2006]|uniref:hypothetical protein n=1 Tax=Halobacillus sp. BBL2006 TaxID=1543706 RepID=UPI0005440B61|nr:hypothetical protein [Halobacillus sp. BBL2006]KHE72241.1 hypothetical protein LD39_05625 [Halobacillus sp. BBL2006]
MFKRTFVEWEMVYATRDLTEYYRVVGTLKNNGFKPKTKTLSHSGVGRGMRCTYQIYVPNDSFRQAEEVLQ